MIERNDKGSDRGVVREGLNMWCEVVNEFMNGFELLFGRLWLRREERRVRVIEEIGKVVEEGV